MKPMCSVYIYNHKCETVCRSVGLSYRKDRSLGSFLGYNPPMCIIGLSLFIHRHRFGTVSISQVSGCVLCY